MADPALLSVRVRVPAKINLYLAVGPAREDGFHELATVFHAVDLCDEVLARAANQLSVSVQGTDADLVPTDTTNLAWRAVALLAERLQIAPHAALQITKNIPVAGGMAGGSADAAATLIACTRLWGIEMSRADLAELAAELGSDVAFGLTGGTALGTGRGELLSPVLNSGELHWAIATADGGISAGDAYRELDMLRAHSRVPAAGEPTVPEPLLEALRSGDAAGVARGLHNDLQAAAVSLRPSLQATLDAGLAAGALGGLVSGSGPTCAFLAASGPQAAQLAAALRDSGTCRDALTAVGPVVGARVVR